MLATAAAVYAQLVATQAILRDWRHCTVSARWKATAQARKPRSSAALQTRRSVLACAQAEACCVAHDPRHHAGEFIPIAEETGQIGVIGNWVLQQACRQAREWRDQGLPAMRVGVNISAVQFHQPGLVDSVRSALQEADLEPRFLEIELTESCVMSNPEESIAVLEELSRMGVLVSVDDFGTGYSSMSYLRRFPIDKLKIDKSFVADMDTRKDDASIVQAIVSLAHGLRLKVVAEGVETQAQLDALKALGCDSTGVPLPSSGFSGESLSGARERRKVRATPG